MFTVRGGILLAAGLLIGTAAAALDLVTEDDPPHNMLLGGKIIGVSTEKLEEALKRTGVSYSIQMMPWARAYQYALALPEHCVFSTARTDERERLFRWVGPIASMDWVLYRRANDARRPATLEEVRANVIGGYNLDVISNWLIANRYRVESAPDDGVNPKKLLAGRLDFWASSRPRATALLAAGKLADQVVPVLTFGHTDLYLACHRGTPAKLIEDLNAALDRMQKDGTTARIEGRYAKWPAM